MDDASIVKIDTGDELPVTPRSSIVLPAIVEAAGEDTARRFVEFFLVSIRNRNTRAAYAQAIRQFLEWCDSRGLDFFSISPIAVAAYIEQHPGSAPTVKQHLAAIRAMFSWMVTGMILQQNPAEEVSGPKHRVKRGKTPVLTDDEMRELLDSIDISDVVGLRDRALIATMFFSFARIGAVLGMQVGDYFPKGKRYWLRLHEKGGKYHEVPAPYGRAVSRPIYTRRWSPRIEGYSPLPHDSCKNSEANR